jgi:hypothetical protein
MQFANFIFFRRSGDRLMRSILLLSATLLVAMLSFSAMVLPVRADTTVATIPVGGAAGYYLPGNNVFDPINGYIYVTTSQYSIAVISGTTMLANLTVGDPHEGAYGSMLGGSVANGGATVDPSNGYLYVPIDTYPFHTIVISGDSIVANLTTGVGNHQTSESEHRYAGPTYDPSNKLVYIFTEEDTSTTMTIINGTTVSSSSPVPSLSGGVGAYTYQPVADPVNGYVYLPYQIYNVNAGFLVFSGSSEVGNINVTKALVECGSCTATPAFFDSENGLIYSPWRGSAPYIFVVSGTSLNATIQLSEGVQAAESSVDASTGDVYFGFGTGASAAITVFSGAKVVANLTNVNTPQVPYYDPVNGYMYVGSGYSGGVYVVSGTNLLGSVPGSREQNTYQGAMTVDTANGNVYTVVNEELYVMSGDTSFAGVLAGVQPQLAIFDPTNGYVYVPDAGCRTTPCQGTVTVLEPGNATASASSSSSSKSTSTASATASSSSQTSTTPRSSSSSSSASASESSSSALSSSYLALVVIDVVAFLLIATAKREHRK